MSLIVTEGLCKRWTDKDVLKNVCVTLGPGDRVGLVGANGEGKTTLLRILIGLEEPSDGKCQRVTGLRIGYLPQDPPALTGSTVRQAMLAVFGDLHRMEQELHAMSEQMGNDCSDPKLLERYGQLQHQFEDGGGYSYSHKIDSVLTGLGFAPAMWEQPLAELSGGQRTRAYLARLLLEAPDILFLDEPTNHLDLEAVEWLEKWVQDFPGAMVVVSHDRYFLDNTTNSTWEISFASLETYRGSYTDYVTKRQDRFHERMKRWEAQQEYIQDTEEFIRRFLAGQRSKEAQGRRTRLERFMRTEAIEKPREHERITVRLRVQERTGDFVVTLSDLQAGYEAGKPLVSVEKLDIMRGQRVAIVGPNGCGKTTLLRTILGSLKSLGGKVRLGANVKIGYLSQTHAELTSSMTPIDALKQIEPAMPEERARNMLGSLLLSGQDAFKQICELSGGQRSRVVLARLMLQRANVLFLDEPTNHLDINSQEVLQDVLSEFDGTVVFVSHDRYLVKALATHIWAVEDGTITALRGDWDRYVQWRDERLGLIGQTRAESQVQAQQAKQDRKEDFAERRRKTNQIQKLQRRLAEVEKAIHETEQKLKDVNAGISKAGEAGDVEKITKLGGDYTAADAKLQELFAEWETISTALEQAGAE